MTDSAAAGVLAALDIALLEPAGSGSFRVGEPSPRWFHRVWPGDGAVGEFRPAARSPFLENFLVDAARYWQRREADAHRSGPWVEVDADGKEWVLEATACRVAGRPFLTIEHIGVSQRDVATLLQRARENALQFQRLVKEIEKKDVLLHCIVHDLRSPLLSVQSLLSLLDAEALAPRTRELVEAGRTQLQRQDVLIRTILDVFAADVDGLEGDHTEAGDLVESARSVVETFAPLFELNQVGLTLELDDSATAGIEVVGERTRLVRIFANLVDNALRHSKPHSSVTIHVRREESTAFAAVDDEGPGVVPELSERLFDRFAQAGGRAGHMGLGLHFCRITVERWGGKIGHANRSGPGSRFWFRLPLSRGTAGTNQ